MVSNRATHQIQFVLLKSFLNIQQINECEPQLNLWKNQKHIWDKVFKNGQIKICRRQPLKDLRGEGLLHAYHTSSKFLKVDFHKFYSIDSWILRPYTEVLYTTSIMRIWIIPMKTPVLKLTFLKRVLLHKQNIQSS